MCGDGLRILDWHGIDNRPHCNAFPVGAGSPLHDQPNEATHVTVTFGSILASLLFVLPGYIFLVASRWPEPKSDIRLILNSILASVVVQLIIADASMTNQMVPFTLSQSIYGIEIIAGTASPRVQAQTALYVDAGVYYIVSSLI